MSKRATSLFLALVMVLSMIPSVVLAEWSASDKAVSALAKLYDGDEDRAKADLEAMYASGLIDEDGNMVELDVREDGESVELSALTERIASGEDVGELTVNGNAVTAEQITQISQVNTALEIVRQLDEDVEITDEHVKNLENLLNGIADGSIDLNTVTSTGVRLLGSEPESGETPSGYESGDMELTEGSTTPAPTLSQCRFRATRMQTRRRKALGRKADPTLKRQSQCGTNENARDPRWSPAFLMISLWLTLFLQTCDGGSFRYPFHGINAMLGWEDPGMFLTPLFSTVQLHKTKKTLPFTGVKYR